jgi:SNF2 family DNA or RNA helicase
MHAKVAEFAKHALAPELLAELGGVTRSNRFDEKLFLNSGKMVVLKTMLENFTKQGEKTLVFSYSTKVLTIIEDFVLVRSSYILGALHSCFDACIFRRTHVHIVYT